MSGPVPEKKKGLSTRQIIGRTAAILVAIGATVGVLYFIPDLERFKSYGYPGVFFISLIGNATVVLPVPSLAVTFAMGAVLAWPLVGLVAGIGEALGEITAYLAGMGGRAVIENRDIYDRLHYWMENHGMLTLFVLSMIPNPFFDMAGIAAGILKYEFYKFLIATWLGKTIKTLFFAWAGSHSITWITWVLG
jgi:uncharacterized membrane protein YdjX (TVP38/TMEM64 family)